MNFSSLPLAHFACYVYVMVNIHQGFHSLDRPQGCLRTSFAQNQFLTEQNYPWWSVIPKTTSNGMNPLKSRPLL